MISFEDALGLVLDSVFETGTEEVSFMDSCGRILAEDVISDSDIPAFDRSAVDGYACKRESLAFEMEVVDFIPAGKKPSVKVGLMQCSKIMTGAWIPEGCDVVIMVEETEILPSGKVRFTGSDPKPNIMLRGEDVKAGEAVLMKGTKIKPQDIGVMASLGHTRVTVGKRPLVGIISTGSELVEPPFHPLPGQIRNSNAYQLTAQTIRAGAVPSYYGIAIDEEEATYNLVSKALAENNIVLLTGGVSMGDLDLVPDVLRKLGVDILFTRVAVQPGKPTTFGVHPKALIFALPGNTVSSFVQFELLIRPAISKMMGYNMNPVILKLPIKKRYKRIRADRLGWLPAKITPDGFVLPVEYHGSAHLTALSEADGLISIQQGRYVIEEGDPVDFRLF